MSSSDSSNMTDTGLAIINVDQLSHAVSEAVQAGGSVQPFLDSGQEQSQGTAQKIDNDEPNPSVPPLFKKCQKEVESFGSFNEQLHMVQGTDDCSQHNQVISNDHSLPNMVKERDSLTGDVYALPNNETHQLPGSKYNLTSNHQAFPLGDQCVSSSTPSTHQARQVYESGQTCSPIKATYPSGDQSISTTPHINMNIAIHLPGMQNQNNPRVIQSCHQLPVTDTHHANPVNIHEPSPSISMSPVCSSSSNLTNLIGSPSISQFLHPNQLNVMPTNPGQDAYHQQLSSVEGTPASLLSPSSSNLSFVRVHSSASTGLLDLSLFQDPGNFSSQQSLSETGGGMQYTAMSNIQAPYSLQESDVNSRAVTSNEHEQSTSAPAIIASSIHSLQGCSSGATQGHHSAPVDSQLFMGYQNSSTIHSDSRLNTLPIQNYAAGYAHLETARCLEETTRYYSTCERRSTEMEDDNGQMWCVDCEKFFAECCPQHGAITVVKDANIQNRAKLTLPSVLTLGASRVSSDCLGVWAKEDLPKGSRFGPLEGEMIEKPQTDSEQVCPRLWKIFQGGKEKHYISTKREDVSNWMMYVQYARKDKEQNLVAYQSGKNIYFVARHLIKKGEELLMWYCRQYATWCGATTFPEDSFKCIRCGKQFAKRSQLDGHIRYSHPDQSSRKYKCNVCSMAFTSSTKLHLHSFKHSGKKPYTCTTCRKSFSDSSNLRQHVKIHTGEKRFKCSICGKAFRQKAHLVTHLVIHTGERKMKCQFCDKTFSRSSDIKHHMILHCQNKQYPCPICKRIFFRQQLLAKHMVSHSDVRKYKCKNCHKAYKTSTHLKRHMQKSCPYIKDAKVAGQGSCGNSRNESKRLNSNSD